jgi:hypothetical protein
VSGVYFLIIMQVLELRVPACTLCRYIYDDCSAELYSCLEASIAFRFTPGTTPVSKVCPVKGANSRSISVLVAPVRAALEREAIWVYPLAYVRSFRDNESQTHIHNPSLPLCMLRPSREHHRFFVYYISKCWGRFEG